MIDDKFIIFNLMAKIYSQQSLTCMATASRKPSQTIEIDNMLIFMDQDDLTMSNNKIF